MERKMRKAGIERSLEEMDGRGRNGTKAERKKREGWTKRRLRKEDGRRRIKKGEGRGKNKRDGNEREERAGRKEV